MAKNIKKRIEKAERALAKIDPAPIDPSKRLKNRKHEHFAQKWVETLNNTISYQSAYTTCSIATAGRNGYVLLNKTEIAARIQYLQQVIAEKTGISKQILRDEWKKIGLANLQDYLLPSGKIKPISQLTRDQAAAVQSIGAVKLQLLSKETALEHLGKHIGFYEKDNNQKKDNLADFLRVLINERK